MNTVKMARTTFLPRIREQLLVINQSAMACSRQFAFAQEHGLAHKASDLIHSWLDSILEASQELTDVMRHFELYQDQDSTFEVLVHQSHPRQHRPARIERSVWHAFLSAILNDIENGRSQCFYFPEVRAECREIAGIALAIGETMQKQRLTMAEVSLLESSADGLIGYIELVEEFYDSLDDHVWLH